MKQHQLDAARKRRARQHRRWQQLMADLKLNVKRARRPLMAYIDGPGVSRVRSLRPNRHGKGVDNAT